MSSMGLYGQLMMDMMSVMSSLGLYGQLMMDMMSVMSSLGVVWPAYDGHNVSHVSGGGCLASL